MDNEHEQYELVGWQQRYIDPDEGASIWQFCDSRTAEILRGRPNYELRPVYAPKTDEIQLAQRPPLSAVLDAWARLPNDTRNAMSMAVFVAWNENIGLNMTTRCERVAAAVMAAQKAANAGNERAPD